MIKYFIDIFSKQGDWVLDLFSGSGNIYYITYETLAAKMWKESQPPSKGMFGNNHFCHFTEVEEPMEENNEVQEERQDVENTNFDEDYGVYDIPN